MSQFAFGVGNFYVTPLQDAKGAAIANPTPVPLMTLQEGTIDLSGDIKELYGQNQFPEAVGRGKMKMTVKVKPARIFAAAWNNLFFGQDLEAGLFANHTDATGSLIPASGAYTVTPTPPSAGTFIADLGVLSSTGSPLKRVATGPTTGQYSVDPSTGTYTFAAADAGKLVYVNYQYSANVVGAQKMTVKNLPMGYAPSFKADLTVAYQGKLTTLSFAKAISNKMTLGLKNEDFAIPEFDFSCSDDGTGNPLRLSLSE